MQGPRGARKVRPQEETGTSHVTLDRARMSRERIDGIEQAPRTRDRSVSRALIAVVVPAGFAAPPHANATRPDHRHERHLVAGKHQADRPGTEALSPQPPYGSHIGSDVVCGRTGPSPQ